MAPTRGFLKNVGEATRVHMVLQRCIKCLIHLKFLKLSVSAFLYEGRLFGCHCNGYSIVLSDHILA